MMRVYAEQVGLMAPGLPGWHASQAVLRAPQEWTETPMERPVAALLPAIERRRASDTVRLALTVAEEALAGRAEDVPAVFGCCHGDGNVTRQICAAIAEATPAVSPTHFHNSVHNAPAGYWSIARKSTRPTSSISAGEATAAAALLEAAVQIACDRQPVLLVVYDLPLPAPLDRLHPTRLPFAAAFLLTPAQTAQSLAAWELTVRPEALPTPELPIAAFDDNPAARCLPLLTALASRDAATVHLPGPCGILQVRHTPC